MGNFVCQQQRQQQKKKSYPGRTQVHALLILTLIVLMGGGDVNGYVVIGFSPVLNFKVNFFVFSVVRFIKTSEVYIVKSAGI